MSKEDFFYDNPDEKEYYFSLNDNSQLHFHHSDFKLQNDSLFISGLIKRRGTEEWEHYKGVILIGDIREIEYPRHTETLTTEATVLAIVAYVGLGLLIIAGLKSLAKMK